ncbi:hypothetical protein QBC36DRAFT_381183 [Triangularia setosa]|uniref:Uncharacterized protein n=1 Tax=Triangularia setosa TaxID=2587417 RepID=A0AAN6W0L1_9PEZI|nr:hypothetical protein QBC36DRAFT_381183 [Podospora setosa]
MELSRMLAERSDRVVHSLTSAEACGGGVGLGYSIAWNISALERTFLCTAFDFTEYYSPRDRYPNQHFKESRYLSAAKLQPLNHTCGCSASTAPPSASQTQLSWADEKGEFFILSDAPQPLPESKDHPAGSTGILRVYAAGDESAVWRAGDAFIKVHDVKASQATREHTTFQFLHDKARDAPLGFEIPTFLYHGEWNSREYHVHNRVPSHTLATTWPSMPGSLRDFYVTHIDKTCQQLASWKRDAAQGVSGHLAQSPSSGTEFWCNGAQ